MIKIEVDNREITEALKRLEASVDDMQPAFDDIGASLVANIQVQLGQGKTPWGNAFEPLKARRGRRVGGIPLNDTRQHIYNRITHNADSHSVEIGMNENAPIGITHQFGSKSKNIPPRPFMPIQDDQVNLPAEWQDELIETLLNHIESGLR